MQAVRRSGQCCSITRELSTANNRGIEMARYRQAWSVRGTTKNQTGPDTHINFRSMYPTISVPHMNVNGLLLYQGHTRQSRHGFGNAVLGPHTAHSSASVSASPLLDLAKDVCNLGH